MLFSIDLERDRARSKIDMCQMDVRQKLRAGTPRRLFQLARNCAHPADRHFPFAGLVADQVIKKTTVLDEGRIMRARENPDFCIGQDKSADEIVL